MSLTRESLLFSPTRDGVPSSDDAFTATDLLSAQRALEEEAAEVIPWAFNHCTYALGHIKQPLFACRTCLGHAAVCAACSVSCHGEHDLVELFNRRDFRCDCGTERMGAGSCCELRVEEGEDMERNEGNKYDQNFKGSFCWCEKGQKYDAKTETDEMFQCLVCENWMHNACLQGVPADADDVPLGTDDFDLLVCARCVQSDPKVRAILERWAGVPGSGVMLLDKDNKILGRVAPSPEEDEPISASDLPDEPTIKIEPPTGVNEKRTREDEEDEEDDSFARYRSPKKMRRAMSPDASSVASSPPAHSTAPTSSSPVQPPKPQHAATSKTCTAPPLPREGDKSILARVEEEGGRSTVFFEEGWYDRWCRCEECIELLEEFPYFLEEEEVYEPPEDPAAHRTMEELGMDALATLPRAQAIDGVMAFQGLSERLKEFLKPHADAGQIITEDLIKSFFTLERERKLAEQRNMF